MSTHFMVSVKERGLVCAPEFFHLGIERCRWSIGLALRTVRCVADELRKRVLGRYRNFVPIVTHMEVFMGLRNGRGPIQVAGWTMGCIRPGWGQGAYDR